MSFAIDDDVPPPKPAKRGRKNAPIPSKAADAVRAGECGIKEAAHRFFDEHIGFATTEAERGDEQQYAERFRDFVLMIATDLRRNPGQFSTYRKLGALHVEKTKYPAYRSAKHTKLMERLREELRSIGVID